MSSRLPEKEKETLLGVACHRRMVIPLCGVVLAAMLVLACRLSPYTQLRKSMENQSRVAAMQSVAVFLSVLTPGVIGFANEMRGTQTLTVYHVNPLHEGGL